MGGAAEGRGAEARPERAVAVVLVGPVLLLLVEAQLAGGLDASGASCHCGRGTRRPFGVRTTDGGGKEKKKKKKKKKKRDVRA